MVTLEQVKLLETKVVKALDFVNQVTGENTLLKKKLDTYQKRIDELEVLIQRFKEDQGRIEEGIISALSRLNQFEDAVEKSLSTVKSGIINQPEEEKSPGSTGDVLNTPGEPSSGIEKKPEEEYLSEPREDAPLLTAAEPDGEFQVSPLEDEGLSELEDSETPETGELDIF
ncbi:MAG: cell division protein ZapB [Spirochaetaceae bacterium]|jgi:chromosome segregation ATPase|nr:cell division protein ZapB [Spirochaetaceae bacterium]